MSDPLQAPDAFLRSRGCSVEEQNGLYSVNGKPPISWADLQQLANNAAGREVIPQPPPSSMNHQQYQIHKELVALRGDMARLLAVLQRMEATLQEFAKAMRSGLQGER